MEFHESGSYGQTFQFDADVPDDIVRDMLWDAASREIGSYFQQGADRVEKIRLYLAGPCDIPAWNDEDPESELGCSPRPHRHCGWKAVVVA